MTKHKHFDVYKDRYEWGFGTYLAYDKAAGNGSVAVLIGYWTLYFHWGDK